jgi:hypothetical protein
MTDPSVPQVSRDPVVDEILLSAKEESTLWHVLGGVRQAMGAPDEASANSLAISTAKRMMDAGWVELFETDRTYYLIRIISNADAQLLLADFDSWKIPAPGANQLVLRTTDIGDLAFEAGAELGF